MDTQQAAALAGVIGTVFGSGWAIIERMRSQKNADAKAALNGKDDVIKVKDEMIKALREEHEQFLAYRIAHHEQVQETQVKMLHLTEENSILRARSDLTPVLVQMESITKTLSEAISMLKELTKQFAIVAK